MTPDPDVPFTLIHHYYLPNTLSLLRTLWLS
jgi:hypothetical protein